MRRIVLHVLARLGAYERRELQLLRRVVPAGGTVIDVGANFGVYARYAADAVGTLGTVLAFEPISPVFAELTTAVQDRPQVHCFRQGISDTSCEQLQFKIPLLFGAIPEPALATVEAVSQYSCATDAAPVTTLDSFLNQLTQVNFIKLDVEDHELACLRGGTALLKKFRPLVQFEENSPRQRLPLFEQFAAEHDYVVATHAAALKPATPLHPVTNATQQSRCYNFYLVPREHPLLVQATSLS
jgi:FkbM family methyltransferase